MTVQRDKHGRITGLVPPAVTRIERDANGNTTAMTTASRSS
jgi:YD repeat-containing protein